jgi:hypothetical protein
VDLNDKHVGIIEEAVAAYLKTSRNSLKITEEDQDKNNL